MQKIDLKEIESILIGKLGFKTKEAPSGNEQIIALLNKIDLAEHSNQICELLA